MKSKNLPRVLEVTEEGYEAFWLGDKTAEVVIIYFHGMVYMSLVEFG